MMLLSMNCYERRFRASLRSHVSSVDRFPGRALRIVKPARRGG